MAAVGGRAGRTVCDTALEDLAAVLWGQVALRWTSPRSGLPWKANCDQVLHWESVEYFKSCIRYYTGIFQLHSIIEPLFAIPVPSSNFYCKYHTLLEGKGWYVQC